MQMFQLRHLVVEGPEVRERLLGKLWPRQTSTPLPGRSPLSEIGYPASGFRSPGLRQIEIIKIAVDEDASAPAMPLNSFHVIDQPEPVHRSKQLLVVKRKPWGEVEPHPPVPAVLSGHRQMLRQPFQRDLHLFDFLSARVSQIHGKDLHRSGVILARASTVHPDQQHMPEDPLGPPASHPPRPRASSAQAL